MKNLAQLLRELDAVRRGAADRLDDHSLAILEFGLEDSLRQVRHRRRMIQFVLSCGEAKPACSTGFSRSLKRKQTGGHRPPLQPSTLNPQPSTKQ